MNIEELYSFVVSSRKRVRILLLLSTVGIARGFEIADLLLMMPSVVSLTTKELKSHDLIDYVQYSRYKVFYLTNKGKKVVAKIGDYYGTHKE